MSDAGVFFALDLTRPDTAHYLGAGWSATESAWTWTLGDDSLLVLPPPPQEHDCRLLVRALPYLSFQRPTQSLDVFANGWHFGGVVVRRPHFDVHAFDISRHAYSNRLGLAVSLRHPDAASPSEDGEGDDLRRLAFGVSQVRLQPLTPEYLAREAELRAAMLAPLIRRDGGGPVSGPADAELVQQFESLGTNCELGFVQRLAGAEPISLLRFAGLPVNKLLVGLERGFEGLASPGRFHVELLPDQPEEGFVGRDETYTMIYHTYRQPSEVSSDDMLAAEGERLPFLARKLLDDLEDGEKIFVVKNDGGLHIDDVLSIEAVVRSYGPGVLLWVEGAEPGHPPGSVEVLRPGLMKGRVDRFAQLTLGAEDVSQQIWLTLLRNAWSLRQHARFA